jgi:hypothetical protein
MQLENSSKRDLEKADMPLGTGLLQHLSQIVTHSGRSKIGCGQATTWVEYCSSSASTIEEQ